MTTTYEIYMARKKAFFRKHKNNFDCYTSPMDEHSRYSKTYTFADGGVWYETMRPVRRSQIVTVEGVEFVVNVKLFETEYFSSDNAESACYYEKY